MRRILDTIKCRFRQIVLVSLCCLLFSVSGVCQLQSLDRPVAAATVVRVIPNPDDSSDHIVTVQVELHSSAAAHVVPDCSENNTGQYELCGARLMRRHGKKWVVARPVVAAVMGVDVSASWTPIDISESRKTIFNFRFSTGFFAVRSGEPLRVAFDTWDSPASVRDWKKMKTQMSTTFTVSNQR
ncbi:MAG: hypothetical protein P4L03_06535 [Terracidiphilus sp.]|nr:hypothetical protein [Terracidiphilus sp.]